MLGEMLRLWMKEHRWSTRQLAPRLGISPATLNRIVRGGSMDAKTMLILINELFKQTEETK